MEQPRSVWGGGTGLHDLILLFYYYFFFSLSTERDLCQEGIRGWSCWLPALCLHHAAQRRRRPLSRPFSCAPATGAALARVFFSLPSTHDESNEQCTFN